MVDSPEAELSRETKPMPSGVPKFKIGLKHKRIIEVIGSCFAAVTALIVLLNTLGLMASKPNVALTHTAPAPSSSAASAPTHVIVHHSGTDVQLSGDDDLIIDDGMAHQPKGHGLEDLQSDDENPQCSGYPYRIFNASNETVITKFGLYETDSGGDIAIGPGERFSTAPLPPGTYYAGDNDDRWAELIKVENCKRSHGK